MSHADSCFALEGELSIYQAAELAQALRSWLDADPARTQCSLDLSGISDIDSAGVQLLLATLHSTRLRGWSLRLIQPSDTVQHALKLLQLHALLQCVQEGATAH